MKKTFILLGLGSALALSGCGGGGGSSGTTIGAGPGAAAPVASTPASTLSVVTATNATQVAASAYASANALSDSSSPVGGLLTGVSLSAAKPGTVGPVLDLLRKAVPRTTPLLTGVTMTEACAGGGTVSIDATLRNQQTLSSGDTMKISATNCLEDGIVINGSVALTVSSVSGDVVNSTNWSATLDAVFTGFTARSGNESAGIGGDMKIAMTQTNATSSTIDVSGKSLQIVEQRNGQTLGTYTLSNYAMNEATAGTTVRSAASFTIAGNSNALGQFSYTVKNLQPFVSVGGANPSSGSMIVNGASSSVTLTSTSSTSVRLEYSAKGDGVITQTSTLSWTELLAAL